MNSTPWIVRSRNHTAKLRLYCFGYAGGNAFSFLPWQASLSHSAQVHGIQLPGRGGRIHEAPWTNFPALISTLAEVIRKDCISQDYALFGHSLGGLVCFEVARALHSLGQNGPRKLIVSGCDAPQFRSSSRRLHTLNDADLIQALRDYNGTPSEVLESPDLLELVLPTLRSDFQLAEDYIYHPSPRLVSPITVLAGIGDEYLSPHQVDGWGLETSGEFKVHWFDGDHFFIKSQERAVLECLKSELSS